MSSKNKIWDRKPRALVALAGPEGSNSSLGNQLFQLAFGIYLQKLHGYDVRYFVRRSHADHSSAINNSNLLTILSMLKTDQIVEFSRSQEFLLRIAHKLRLVTVISQKSEIDSNTSRKRKWAPVLVSGYFQHYEIVDAVKDEILRRFKSSNAFEGAIGKKCPRIAVHVRCGDYISNPVNRSLYGLPNLDYYLAATTQLMTELQISTILIISDDPDMAWTLVGSHIALLPDVSVSHCSGSLLEDFASLSISEGIVMSNSTFAWWAAWLGYVQGCSTVVCPRPWYLNDAYDSGGLEYPGWPRTTQ